jgi:preprotein translocase subunit SecA
MLKITDFEILNFSTKNSEIITTGLINFLLEMYESHRKQYGSHNMSQAEKWLLLETIDQAWKQLMLNLDHLKEGIGLRSWGQKNPLIEYKREAFDMFRDMMSSIQQQVIFHIFHLNTAHFDQQRIEAKREKELEEINLISGQTSDSQTIQRKPEQRIGRNDLCYCGSGKKFKKCHGG